MTVSTEIDVEFTLLPAGSDPRKPTGTFQARGDIEGDGTGGVNRLRFVFAETSHPPHAVLFAMTQLRVSQENNAAPVVEILPNGFTANPFNLGTGTGARVPFVIRTAAGPSFSDGIWTDNPNSGQSWELGYPVTGVQVRVDVTFPNVNGVAAVANVEGLFWLAEAAFEQGGPVSQEATYVPPLSYGVGDTAYYAQLRRGQAPYVPVRRAAPPGTTNYTHAQQQAIAQTVSVTQAPVGNYTVSPKIRLQSEAERQEALRIIANQSTFAGGVRGMNDPGLQVAHDISDERILESVAAEIFRTGASVEVAASRILGQSPQQVQAQLAKAAGMKVPPPGAAYANLTASFEGR